MAINGSIEGKYRAAHLIIEQVEIFKYGGPVSTVYNLFVLYFIFSSGVDHTKWKSIELKLSCLNLKLRAFQRIRRVI